MFISNPSNHLIQKPGLCTQTTVGALAKTLYDIDKKTRKAKKARKTKGR